MRKYVGNSTSSTVNVVLRIQWWMRCPVFIQLSISCSVNRKVITSLQNITAHLFRKLLWYWKANFQMLLISLIQVDVHKKVVFTYESGSEFRYGYPHIIMVEVISNPDRILDFTNIFTCVFEYLPFNISLLDFNVNFYFQNVGEWGFQIGDPPMA